MQYLDGLLYIGKMRDIKLINHTHNVETIQTEKKQENNAGINYLITEYTKYTFNVNVQYTS